MSDLIIRAALWVAQSIAVRLWRRRRRPMQQTIRYLTLPEAALRIGLSVSKLRRTMDRSRFRPPVMVGSHVGFTEADLPQLREAAKATGYPV